jgi:SAM-dependent methyltransferase
VSSEATTAAYDAAAEAYAERWAGVDTAVVEVVERFASELRPGALVLDLGCGPGRDLRWLARHGFRPVGLDRSGGMLGYTARHASGTPLICGDMARLPLCSDAVDGLWSCASFLHIPKREAPAVLAEFARVLRPGGLLGLTVKRGDGEGWTTTRGRRFLAWWQPAELDAALAVAGFRVVWAAESPDPLGREPWLERCCIGP